MAEDIGDDPDLNIEVTATADTAAIPETTRQVEQLGQAAEEAGSKSGKGFSEAGHTLREVLVDARHSHEIFRGIGEAANGSVGSIMGMVRAFRALVILVGEAMGALGPAGWLVLGLGAIGGALLAIGRHSKEASDGLGDTKSKADQLTESLKKVGDAVKKDFEPLAKAVKEIDDRFADLDKRMKASTEELEKLQAAQFKVKESEMELAKAKELSAAKDETERKYIESKYAALKDEAAAKKEVAEADKGLLDAQAEKLVADKKAEELAAQAAEAQAKVTDAQKNLDEVSKKALATVRETHNLEDERERLNPAHGRLWRGPASEVEAQSADTREVRARAFGEVAQARERLEKSQSEAAPIVEKAAKAQKDADALALKVSEEQLVATANNTAAMNKLTEALLKKADADKAEVTGGGETKGGIEGDAKRAANAEARVESQAAKASEKKAATEAREQTREAAKLQHEITEATAHQTRALKATHKAAMEGSEAAKTATHEVHQARRVLINETSYDSSP